MTKGSNSRSATAAAGPVAAIMIGAVVTTVATMDAAMAILPFVVGALASVVAFGRTRLAPLTNRCSSRAALQRLPV